MNESLLFKFKDYVSRNYDNCDLTNLVMCSHLHSSKIHLDELIISNYDYTAMEYLDNYRILKSIELISNMTNQVYIRVGYKSITAFSKAFLRITGFHASYFYTNKLEEYKDLAPIVYSIAEKDPKKAIQFIINNTSIRTILLEQQKKIKFRNLVYCDIKPFSHREALTLDALIV